MSRDAIDLAVSGVVSTPDEELRAAVRLLREAQDLASLAAGCLARAGEDIDAAWHKACDAADKLRQSERLARDVQTARRKAGAS